MYRRRHLALTAAWLAGAAIVPRLPAACAGRETAPDIDYTLLDGRIENLAERHGQVTLVQFWATICPVCRREMSHTVALQARFSGQGFGVLAVAMRYDPPVFVADYTRAQGLTFDVAIDNTGAIARAFGEVEQTPTYCLIDRQGRFVQRHVGVPDFGALQQTIAGLLAQT